MNHTQPDDASDFNKSNVASQHDGTNLLSVAAAHQHSYGGAGPHGTSTNVLSLDSMSQASSTRRTGKVKVIYNKFFKQKGFLPPLAAGVKDYQPTSAANQ